MLIKYKGEIFKIFCQLFGSSVIKPYLRDNKFRHASLRTAYQGGTFALIGYGIHEKPIDYPQQIQMLKERGLIINDEEQALEQFRIISYFLNIEKLTLP